MKFSHDISRLSGEFTDAKIEQDFLKHNWSSSAWQLRIVFAFGFLAYGAAAIPNYLDLGMTFGTQAIFAGRAITCLSFVWVIVETLQKQRGKRLRLAISLSQILFASSETVEVLVYSNAGQVVDPQAAPFFVFVILIYYGFIENSLKMTSLASAIGSAFLIVGLASISDDFVTTMTRQIIFIIAAMGFGTGFLQAFNRLRRLQWARGIELEHEISERRKAEELALEASQAKDRFLATMSHELRTPLQGVMGMANLLKDGLSGRDRERAEIIEISGQNLLVHINEILDVVRSNGSIEPPQNANFDLHATVRGAVNLVAVQAGQNTQPITAEIADDVPQWVFGDGGKTQRVLINLLSNAQKYGGDTPISVRVALDPDKAEIMFSVSDQGPGFPPEKREVVFEEFIRLDSTAGQKPGLGLGLAICRRLVTAMQGQIWIDPASEIGTTVHFCVPYQQTQQTTQAPELDNRPRAVLLVEDLEINQRVLSAYLTRAGHVVDIAQTGQEALSLTSAKRFEVIFMDISLPDMTGLDVCRALRQGHGGLNAETPIVALTANALADDHAEYLQGGMNGVLAKPVLPEVLMAAVQHPLEIDAILSHAAQIMPPEPETVVNTAFLEDEIAALGAGIVTELLGDFEAQSRDLMTELAEFTSPTTAQTVLHKLRGLAANFGFVGFCNACEELEPLAATTTQEDWRNRVEELNRLLDASLGKARDLITR